MKEGQAEITFEWTVWQSTMALVINVGFFWRWWVFCLVGLCLFLNREQSE